MVVHDESEMMASVVIGTSTDFIKNDGRRGGGEKGELIALHPSPT
jgi:hypothetical protein